MAKYCVCVRLPRTRTTLSQKYYRHGTGHRTIQVMELGGLATSPTIRRPGAPLAQHRLPGFRHASSLRCREMVSSTHPLLLASRAKVSSDAVEELGVCDPYIRFSHEARGHSIEIGYPQLLVSCAGIAACTLIREHLLLQVARG